MRPLACPRPRIFIQIAKQRMDFFSLLKEKTGNVATIAALLMVPLVVGAGGAVDFIRHEHMRLALQDTLDRGVLAAASLTQNEEPRAVIESYLKSVGSLSDIQLTVTDRRELNARKVSATATRSFEPAFLQMAGIESLTVVASSAAQEAKSNIEVSMVLDISGSMLDNGGMSQLRPAAKSFLDVILKPDRRNVTSVSLVPFAGEVNLGAGVFDYLAGPLYTRRHSYSSCFEFVNADFAAGTPLFPLRDQVPHFTYYNYNVGGKKPWWCPTDDASVTYPTNDLSYLKTRVDALQPFDGTGTAYGMKWGELLLNPAMRPVIKAIANKGLAPIPSQFVDRPAAFSDKDTLKFIVLMTDGQIGFQPRPKDLTTNAVTTKNISAKDDNRTLYTEAESVAFYKQVCAYTRSEGITVFTIAFKVSDSVAANIATCATDPSYAYKVDGLDMGAAFQSIATTMQNIRLVD